MNGEPSPPGTWYETTQVENHPRPRLTFDLDVDVCVVGGGLAGLTAAREVARRGWSVAVLEAQRIAWAASGRNSGFVLPGFGENVDAMIERIGLDHTKQLWALSEQGVDYVRTAIGETGMTGAEVVNGWLRVSKTDRPEAVRAEVERLRWLGAEVEAWPTERVRALLPSDRYFGAIHAPHAFHVHPLNYALGLARAAEGAGARIFEETPAVAIDASGVRKRVQTPSGRVRAGHVVLAGNVNLGALMPRLAATLLPVTTYVMVTEPIAQLDEIIRFRGAVSDTDQLDNHYRIVGGNRLQWSGRMTVREADPRRFGRALMTSLRRIFPQLGTPGIAHLWSGTLGRPIHGMPQIGEMQRGVWVASGFAGHGLNTTAIAGDLVARGIVESDQTWRLFAPYELVWAGGRVARLVTKTLYVGSRPAAAAIGLMSRYRERARRRKADKAAARQAAALAAAEAARRALRKPETPPPPGSPPGAGSENP